MKLYLLDQRLTSEGREELDKEIKEEFIFKLIKTRSSAYQYQLSPTVVILLGYLSQVPGKAVMYLTYLQYIVSKKYKDLINTEIRMKDITRIFPVGFFSDKIMNEVWDTQKIDFRDEERGFGSDNLVDHQEAMESIWVR
jgi:hypothetical protein